MRTIKEIFKDEEEKHPDWSTYVIFSNVVMNHKYRDAEIRKWFNRLVDREDYGSRREKEEILKYLIENSAELPKTALLSPLDS
jgi:hypothetical protein